MQVEVIFETELGDERKFKSETDLHLITDMILLTPSQYRFLKLSHTKTVVYKSSHIEKTQFFGICFEHIEYKFILANKLFIC